MKDGLLENPPRCRFDPAVLQCRSAAETGCLSAPQVETARLLTLDAAFFDTHRVGELTSRLNGDVATIRGAVGSSLSMFLRGIVTMLGGC